MPASEAERLDWAFQHLCAARDLFDGKKHYGWAATALFYSGMHAFIAGLQRVPGLTPAQRNPESHEGKTPGAEGTGVILRNIAPQLRLPYDSLFIASWDARYRGGAIERGQVRELRRQDLAQVTWWACDQLHADPDCTCWLTTVGDGWPQNTAA